MVYLRHDWMDHLGAVQKEMERFMEHFSSSKPPAVRFSPRAWQPAVDIYETETEVVVLIELAGASLEDMSLSVENNILTAVGRRQDKHPERRKSYCQMEVAWGPFQRAIPLPTVVDADAAWAEYHDGLVEVFLPKAKVSHSYKAPVKVR